MNGKSLLDLETENLQRRDPVALRNEEIDRMYASFQQVAEKDTYMTLSDFRKYEILFSSETRRKIDNNEMSTDEIAELGKLSEELYRRINTQRPLHIVDDYSGKEVCPPLPPIYRRLQPLTDEKGSDIMAVFSQMLSKGDNLGPHIENKKKQAVAQLHDEYLSKQSVESLERDRHRYSDMVSRFNHEVLGTTIEQPSDTVTNTPEPTISSPSVDENPDDDFFED